MTLEVKIVQTQTMRSCVPERRSVSPDFILAFAVSIGIILTMGAQLQTRRLGEWSGHLKSGVLSV